MHIPKWLKHASKVMRSNVIDDLKHHTTASGVINPLTVFHPSPSIHLAHRDIHSHKDVRVTFLSLKFVIFLGCSK